MVVTTTLLICTSTAYAQSETTMSHVTIDGGGGTSTDSRFSLSGTIGQGDAGEMQGGDFTIIGGFWGPLELETTGEQPDKFSMLMPFLMRQSVAAQ
jgi:hypothetical protein